MKVKKAVIPAAGFGTRFLPFTKNIAKIFVPILNKPIIHCLIEDLQKEGIEEIIIVTDQNDKLCKKYLLEEEPRLLEHLEKKKKYDLISQLKIIDSDRVHFVNQKGPYGNGTPILNVRELVGEEPFIYMWSDSFITTTNGVSALKQVLDAYDKYGATILSALFLSADSDYDKYAYAAGKEVEQGLIEISEIIEKPGKEKAPSNLAVLGGFVFTPDIFAYTKRALKNKKEDEELYYTSAVSEMLKDGKKVLVKQIEEGKYYDVGNKLDFLKTQVEYGLRDKDVSSEFMEFLKNLTK